MSDRLQPLEYASKLKWAGASALVFATGLPAAVEVRLMNLNDLVQNPATFIPVFSVAGAFIGSWIVTAHHAPYSVRHRVISRLCGVLTAALAALGVLQLATATHDPTILGTELIMIAFLALCGTLLGGFLGHYLHAKLQHR
jgi:predicted permease